MLHLRSLAWLSKFAGYFVKHAQVSEEMEINPPDFLFLSLSVANFKELLTFIHGLYYLFM